METLRRSLWPTLALLALIVAGWPASASAQAQDQTQGTITGRVTDAGNGQPVASVQINVLATNTGAQTNDNGEYTIRGLRPGQLEVRALRVGYSEQRLQVTVAGGQTATLDIRMQPVAVMLNWRRSCTT